jgi:hypothetical protein
MTINENKKEMLNKSKPITNVDKLVMIIALLFFGRAAKYEQIENRQGQDHNAYKAQ